MKKSIKRLPKRTQEELAVLQELILKYLANVHMIILYGSYARGEHVIWDESYDEHGVQTYYQSDLDILVICDTGDTTKAERYARDVITARYDKRMEGKRHPAPPQIIVENTMTINRAIRRKHYFFYEILKEGILFYDGGTFHIGKPETLPYREIKKYAEEEYAECFRMGEGFLKHGKLSYKDADYKLGSFLLHQACERYYKTYMLVHSASRPKSHKLEVLGAMARSRSREFAYVFPVNTPEEKESFDKLCRAYIEARYSREFTVSKEQYEYMLARTEVLREVTIRECAARMSYYDKMIVKEEKEAE
ncbi:HEPN domain-containing protein [uncultured Bacteroides sp.]|uniref:HEPN domain-containing protein n=1 Tax=uncultured Bacteroides sp. TaxID=162156 RepID=UPI0025D09E5C|nr:HEPN domain-containing protein [uncultured Bacteroides sp.]